MVASLSSQENGLYYFVGSIIEEKLRNVDINTISQTMSAGAPCLWELIGGLLMADVDLKSRREKRQEHAVRKGGGLTLMSTASYWQPMTDHGSSLIRVLTTMRTYRRILLNWRNNVRKAWRQF